MMTNPVFLGFSMAQRNNRRLLVVATYGVLFLLMIGMFAARADMIITVLVCLNLAWLLASGSVLGRLIKNTSVPQSLPPREPVNLGLTPKHHGLDEMDERDVAVRNAACFKAYRVVAAYAVLLYLTPAVISSSYLSTRLCELLLTPLMAMAVTLPQAIVLWNEPDLPMEA